MILREYLQSRTDTEAALFVCQRGGRLQPSGARWMLKKLGERAGVDHVHPHKFRRTLATEMAKDGMPIQEIMVFLGHEKTDTTMKYVNVDDGDVKYKYRRFVG
jgi:site-specific recombinase XerD